MSEAPAAVPPRAAQRRLFAFSSLLILSSVVLMGQFAKTLKKAEDDTFYEFAAMFSEVYKQVKDRYVEDVDSKKLFEGALQGMFMTLDPHSQFMDPDNFTQLEKDTEGAFSGIGIHITMKDGVLTCISPMPGSPAAKAGMRPWDRIVEIDGKKTEGITLPEAVKKLTGPTGTTVKVKVYRDGESDFLPFELIRNNIKVDSVIPRMLDDKIAYARITKFSDNTSRDLRKAIEMFREKGAKGIIVDLRFNTGGLLKEAIDVSNLFLPKGKLIVSTKGRVKSQNAEYRAEQDAATDLPLVVLINKGSASASEILAGAIKDHKRGVVLGIKGQRSFGKGSVQTIEELTRTLEKDENGTPKPAAIRLTTAKYYLPNGETIDKQGVTPDIAVELPKGADGDLIRRGMIGDPTPEEDDAESSKTKFNWKDGGKPSKDAAPTSLSAAAATPAASADKDKDKDKDETNKLGELDEDSIVGSALKSRATATTTSLEPRRVIAMDKALIKDEDKADEEAAAKKAAEKRKRPGKDWVDYQLKVAERLLHDHIDKGLDFYAPEAGAPAKDGAKTTKSVVEAKPATAPVAASN